MNIKSFCALVLLLAIAAGSLFLLRSPGVQPPPKVPEVPAKKILVDPDPAVKVAPPVPTPPPPVPVEAPSIVHAEKVQPKPPVVAPANGGTVEREDNPRLVRMDDGSLIIDKYWTILGGDGSEEHPLRLTWELLLSGQGSLDAPDGEIPDRLKWLNGKYVEVKGFTLKSAAANLPVNEFLLNDQLMDNCPICTARSVFATISVKVKAAEMLERGVINVFTVRGRFKAEPTRAAGFLLGVFSLQDGEIISRAH
jgi:hypothetical protein